MATLVKTAPTTTTTATTSGNVHGISQRGMRAWYWGAWGTSRHFSGGGGATVAGVA